MNDNTATKLSATNMASESTYVQSTPEKETLQSSPSATITSVPDTGDIPEPAEETYQSGYKLFVIMVAFCLCTFLVALDTTIISTAIPVISHQFNALEDVGWYVSAYFLTNCTFQFLYGKLYSLYSVKPIYIVAMIIFEIGSLICGVAPNSAVFIFGRAVAGLGAAGTFSGALIAIVHVVRPDKRAAYSGMIVGMYGIASIAGPLIGGAFTSHVTWRWCFYINLPIGGVTTVGLLLFLHTPQPKNAISAEGPRNMLTRILELDPIGAITFLLSIICLLLALQLGGTTYAFSNGRIIALFILFGILLIAFLALQVWGGKNVTLPISLMKQRSIIFGMLYMFCVGSHFIVLVYYLPIWFQGVRGESALQSGIDTLPILLAQTVSVVFAGIFVSVTGYYIPFMWASVVLTSIGAGLLTTLEIKSSSAKWIGYQIIYGIGGGLGYQQGITAAQTVLGPTEVAMGTTLMVFIQNLGGTIFISAGNSLFVTLLVQKLSIIIPGLNPTVVTSAGATGFKNVVTATQYPLVLVAYNSAVVYVFQMALILACLGTIGAAGMEWRRAPTNKKPEKDGEIADGQANQIEMDEGLTVTA